MTPEQALHLYRQINKGPAVGVDTDGNVLYTETLLGNSMEMLGVPNYIYRSHHDPQFKERGRTDGNVYVVEKQVAFLREWADALEKLWVVRDDN